VFTLLSSEMARVDQLPGIDAAFLYLETPTQHMHVCGTMVLQPGCGNSADAAAERLTQLLLDRLSEIPAFRRRVVDAPLRLTHPAWLEVPRFRARSHVRHATVASPGTQEQLAAAVGQIAGKPLDRSRPLWELWILRGLEHGRIGIVLKIHHVLVDGVAALGVLGRLFSLEENALVPPSRRTRRKRKRSPTRWQLTADVLATFARAPGKVIGVLGRTGNALMLLARQSVELVTTAEHPAMLFSAPRTSFNRALTAERVVAFGRVPLSKVKEIKNAFGVTVNDVVLAACSRALGEYLRAHGEAPDRALVATVPVSEHVADEEAGASNRVSAMFIALPVHVENLAVVVRSIHEQSIGAKKVYAAFGPSMLAEWADLMPPQLFAASMELYSRWHLAEHVPPAHSVVISNVAGPPVPLFAGDDRLLVAYPLGPILEGAALNMTVISYDGAVDLGLIACPQAVPQPSEIARGFERAIDELVEVAGSSRPRDDLAPSATTPADARP
jgi:diacylglycerol O-acyltransferase